MHGRFRLVDYSVRLIPITGEMVVVCAWSFFKGLLPNKTACVKQEEGNR